MSAPASIRQSDIKKAVALVKASGVVIEIEKDGMKIRILPDSPDIQSKKTLGGGSGIRL